nr:MAG TPA: hypothetical protein [Caudoviricetes sp.]
MPIVYNKKSFSLYLFTFLFLLSLFPTISQQARHHHLQLKTA